MCSYILPAAMTICLWNRIADKAAKPKKKSAA